MINPLRLLLLTVAITLTACVSQTVRTVDMTAPSQPRTDIPETLLLDVGVALFDPGSYPGQYPDCDINLADINGDGFIDAGDIEPFISLLFP